MTSGPRAPILLILLAAAVLAASTAGMIAGIEPFATWYYQLAWYPTLLAADAFVRLRTGRFFLLEHPRFTAALFAWSVPFWLLFELLNFRMANWYYVFVPADPVTRWTGIIIAFATVLPAIFVAERVLAVAGGSARTAAPIDDPAPGSASGLPGWLPGLLQLVGVAMVVVALAWPQVFYPLIWGAVTLLLDPLVYRRDPHRSLLGDLARRRPGRILRLLLGGLVIGLIWELFNSQARGKWIYTVPGLEELKLFEMPIAGFLGFPVLALDGWAFWQTLVVYRLTPSGPDDTRERDPAAGAGPGPQRAAPDPRRAGRDPQEAAPDPRRAGPESRRAGPSHPRRFPSAVHVAAALLAVTFSALILRGMERFTISSYTPRVADLPDVEPTPLLVAGYDDVFELAAAPPAAVARTAGIPADSARRAVERARLVALRGIGTDNARALIEAGIASVDELAATPADEAVARLRGLTFDARHPARIRVWVRAARSETPRPSGAGERP
jgi:predicted flap endonuclease-1-like 5' DNA nuclease